MIRRRFVSTPCHVVVRALDEAGLVGVEHTKDALSGPVLLSYLQDELLGVARGPHLLIDGAVEAVEGLEGDLGVLGGSLDACHLPLEQVLEEPFAVDEGRDY